MRNHASLLFVCIKVSSMQVKVHCCLSFCSIHIDELYLEVVTLGSCGSDVRQIHG